MPFVSWWNSELTQELFQDNLAFSKRFGQLGSVFCEPVLHWCWWAAACSATSSLNKRCDCVQCAMSRGTTSQETKSKGKVEESRSALLSRSCRSRELVVNLGEIWIRSRDREARLEMEMEQMSWQLLWHSSSLCLELNWQLELSIAPLPVCMVRERFLCWKQVPSPRTQNPDYSGRLENIFLILPSKTDIFEKHISPNLNWFGFSVQGFT